MSFVNIDDLFYFCKLLFIEFECFFYVKYMVYIVVLDD